MTDLGLKSSIGVSLYYTHTLEIEELLSELKTIIPLIGSNSNDLQEGLELEVLYSSEVEGYFSTRRDLNKFINKERQPKSRDDVAVYSNYLALQYAIVNKDNLFTKDFILDLNSLILNDKVIDYRLEPVEIVNKFGHVIHEGIPFEELDDYMNNLIEFAKSSKLEPLINACVIHYYLVYIHAFIDGNGRTARAYSYMYLIYQRVSSPSLFSISYMLPKRRGQYYRELKKVEDNGYDLTSFITFMLHVMMDGLNKIRSKHKLINLIDNTKQIYELYYLNYNDITETLLNYIYDKNTKGEEFSLKTFYKKFRRKLLKSVLEEKDLSPMINYHLETLIEYKIINNQYIINPKLYDKK